MPYTVTLAPDNTEFPINDNEPILAAAKRHGLNLPHSCQNGICGQCKAEIIEGEGLQGSHAESALSSEEASQGKILMCCCGVKSNIRLKVPAYNGLTAPPVKTLPTRVTVIEIKNHTAIVKLALPKVPPFIFHPGQYIDILLPNNQTRSYSIANNPQYTEGLELHIRKHDNGLFSNMIFNDKPTVQPKSILRIRGPLGTFSLREGQKPIIFLAAGTGFAPIQSMLHHLINIDSIRPVHLYWGMRTIQDFYALDTAENLIAQLPNARFTPVLSRANSDWHGARGYVQDHVIQDYPDLSGYEVYTCGSPQMIQAAKTVLSERCRLPEHAFFSDIFLPAST
ncbi:2Fe-2S iron-sulfur cluster-binding protein [Neisseria sp. S1]|uniref:2Fe-2S iron-sulfur cluster-binding protein n=1 Tax=Neisseria sp. S1 TaxID=3318354 RepID=UPI003A8374D6